MSTWMQGAAAEAVERLTSEESYQDAIVEAGALPALVRLLESDNTSVQVGAGKEG